MKKNKLYSSLLLLFIITLAISFYPNILYAKKETTLLNTKDYWKLSTQNESTLTASELAYYISTQTLTGSKLDEIYISNPEDLNSSNMRENTVKIWNNFVGKYQVLNSYIQPIFYGDIDYFANDTVLTIIKNTPMTLSFVDITLKTDTEIIELIYEEKTGMIDHLNLAFLQVDLTLSPDISKRIIDELNQITHEYYTNQLKLPPSQYYFHIDTYNDYLYISFGINSLKDDNITD